MEKERDESRPYGSRHNKSAFVHCEIFVQTAHLFCVKIFFVANKPSIWVVVKNQQIADNQPLATSTPFLTRQKPPQSSPFTR